MRQTLANAETDPYLASAIEFMYSEDTDDDFNTLGRQQQEELLKKTWIEREKQFYGEEIDDETERQGGTIQEQPENEEQDDSSDDDIARSEAVETFPQPKKDAEERDLATPSASSESTTIEPQSKYQIMKMNHQRMQALQHELKEKQYRI